jgi:WD40 repeat protein
MVASGGDRTVRLWDAGTGKELRKLGAKAGWVPLVVFSPDGKLLAAVGQSGIDVWDAATGEPRYQINRKRVHSLTFSPDSRLLATSALEEIGTELWDSSTGERLRELDDSKHGTHTPAFSPDGKVVIAASGARLFLWDVATGKFLRWCEGPENWQRLHNPRFSADGKEIIAWESGNVLWYWEAATGKLLRKTPVADQDRYSDVVLSPDMRLVSLSGQDHSIHLGRVPTGKPLGILEGHEGAIHSIAFSPDGKLLASGGNDRIVRLWDVAAGREVRRFAGHTNGILVIAFSGNGATLASGSWDKTVRTWDVGTGKELRRLEHPNQVERLALSPDGRTLAAKPTGSSLSLWDLATGDQLPDLKDQSRWLGISHLAFSPDGRMLAMTRDGGVGQLWETSTGRLRRSFETEVGLSLLFSPDGHVLASLGGTVVLWDATGRGTTAPARLSARELDRLWEELTETDAGVAHRAIGKLAQDPGAAVLLQERFRDLAALDRRITRLIADLDDDRFEARDKASNELERLGSTAEPALRNALGGKPSLEVQQRLTTLLEKLIKPEQARPSEHIWVLRAIEALEQAGTPEARAVLETLAKDKAKSRLAHEAADALQRLAGRR